jgi:hypothetical protein
MSKANLKTTLILAEFESPAAILIAAEKLRDSGYKNFDCHSPYPIHGMNQAMGLKRSALGYLVGIAAIIGFTAAIIFQWWTSVIDYPIVISGKPLFSYQAFVPVTFALAVLFSAIAVTLGLLIMNHLPRYFHPLFSLERFKKVTDDGFFISMESKGPSLDLEKAKTILETIGGRNIEIVVDEN